MNPLLKRPHSVPAVRKRRQQHRGRPAGAPAESAVMSVLVRLGGLAAVLLCACRPGPAPTDPAAIATPSFVEVAAAAGLDWHHHNGATGELYYPELMQGGAAWLDYDNDGDLDAYVVQSGPLPHETGRDRPGNRLFRNLGDGRFEDATESAGVGDLGYGSGVAVGDVDGDGWVDLYVTNLGPNVLYRNTGPGADGTVAFARLETAADPGYSTSAAFVDYDADGDLDLYVCNYLDWSPQIERPCFGANGLRGYCSPGVYDRPQPDTLYRNDGGAELTDVSTTTGIGSVAGTGLGVVTADFDGDGRVDIYVANDQMANHLWLNNGAGESGEVTFREEALLRGCALNENGLPEAGMGVVVEDPDSDGDWDLFVVHLSLETNTYYRNVGGGFRDVTDELRLGAVSRPYTGFGTGLFDYDNDGTLDLFIANGKVRVGDKVDFDYREPNQLLRGGTDGGFDDVTAVAGEALALLEVSRGAAFGDYDDDGDVDILLVNNDGPLRLLRNQTRSGHHYLTVRLVGRQDRDALGAVVEITAGDRSWRRMAQPAYGYCTSNDPRVHFGLGDIERVDRLTVIWRDGSEQQIDDVAIDQIVEVEQRMAGSVPE